VVSKTIYFYSIQISKYNHCLAFNGKPTRFTIRHRYIHYLACTFASLSSGE
jgi:hypothetical protein